MPGPILQVQTQCEGINEGIEQKTNEGSLTIKRVTRENCLRGKSSLRGEMNLSAHLEILWHSMSCNILLCIVVTHLKEWQAKCKEEQSDDIIEDGLPRRG